MLSENDEVISFYPGSSAKKGQVTLGRIVVHDRLKVEADVLPRYFNHSSFASLRRQLNYFSFTRLGKGRQRGATYCNEAVIEVDDILRLKRRSAVGPNSQRPISTPGPQSDLKRSVSLSSSYTNDDFETEKHHSKKPRYNHYTKPIIVSPRASPVHDVCCDEEPRITLDLTTPSHQPNKILFTRDAEILAGCKALLSFSKGYHFKGGIGV